MNPSPRRSAVEQVADQLRDLSFSVPEGTLLGSEDALVDRLSVGRNTVRQAARLLEREGVMRVRCGINGGYFAARPDLGTIEHAVSAYLTSIAVTVKDVTNVASLLWAEVVGRAARLPSDLPRTGITDLIGQLDALTADADFQSILELELKIRKCIFALTDSAYIEMIFQINYSFARGAMAGAQTDAPQLSPDFPERWRKAKLMELYAVLDRDEKLAEIAARHSRNIWHEFTQEAR